MLFAGLRNHSVAELNELLEEVETAIRHYSEELVRQLARRDELDFEKEVMNGFISELIDIQNLQKEHKELLKKKRKVKRCVREQNGRLQRLPASVSEKDLMCDTKRQLEPLYYLKVYCVGFRGSVSENRL